MSEPATNESCLEKAYDQSKWAANMQDVLARHARLSEATRSAIGEPIRLAYGPSSNEFLDIYRADETPAPVVVFIHGGGWRGGAAKDHAFPAEVLLASNVHFAALDFSPVDASGDLAVLVDQVRRGLAWLHLNCASLGGDAHRLFVVGHSSGAHLAAMALSTNWADYGLSTNPIKGGVVISGIYDLKPLRQTSRSKLIHIDDHVEQALSPLHQVSGIASPLVVAVGSSESPEFQRQAQDYTATAVKCGKSVELLMVENYNHFEILDTLGNPYGPLGRKLLNFITTGKTNPASAA